VAGHADFAAGLGFAEYKMPLQSIPGPDAVTNLKTNEFSRWPARGQHAKNRVEPRCEPGLHARFRLVHGEKIFTIGSCFARNIERSLEIRGFEVVTRKIAAPDREFEEFGPEILNNYGVPSIFNELSWALDPATPFDEDRGFAEVMPGRYIDLHVPRGIRPTDLRTVLARRETITAITRRVVDCRVVVMTLGLSEVWYDNDAGTYLNMAAPRSLIARDPERFQLHVLRYAETLEHLRKIVRLLGRFCRPDQRILLTVSPVPLAATHTKRDVLVANCYSKSVLRVAADEIIAENAHIDYFPSYESITLSERATAWRDDLHHVQPDLIDFNVNRMIEAYAPDTAGEVPADLDRIVAEAHTKMKSVNLREAIRCLEPVKHRLAEHAELALTYASVCTRIGRNDDARGALQHVPEGFGGWRRKLLEVRIALADGAEARALEMLTALSVEEPTRIGVWQGLTEAYVSMKCWDEAVVAASRWAGLATRNGEPLRQLAEIHRAQGQTERADAVYRTAIERGFASSHIALDYAEFLLEQRRLPEAATIISKAAPESRGQQARLQRLRKFLPQ
jgi:thioredoxin-like negative regulator of GroEL